MPIKHIESTYYYHVPVLTSLCSSYLEHSNIFASSCPNAPTCTLGHVVWLNTPWKRRVCDDLQPQTWVAQILHESYDESNGGTSFSGDELADGRVLCRVANAIAWGSVETIHQDESITSQVSLLLLHPSKTREDTRRALFREES